jgi:hypothetical protein
MTGTHLLYIFGINLGRQLSFRELAGLSISLLELPLAHSLSWWPTRPKEGYNATSVRTSAIFFAPSRREELFKTRIGLYFAIFREIRPFKYS